MWLILRHIQQISFDILLKSVIQLKFDQFSLDIRPVFREFWSVLTYYMDFRYLRLDVRDFRSNFRTFVHRISDLVCSSIKSVQILFSERKVPRFEFDTNNSHYKSYKFVEINS